MLRNYGYELSPVLWRILNEVLSLNAQEYVEEFAVHDVIGGSSMKS